MERKGLSKMRFVTWSKVWIVLLLLWSYAVPAVVSARSTPAGNWDRGTIQKIAAGEFYSLALKSDGTVAVWGRNSSGLMSVPEGLTDVVSIAAGASHSLALKSDGTVVAWGSNDSGQTNVPSSLTGVVAIAAGWKHSLALKSDGTVEAWGRHVEGQTTVPGVATGVVAIAAGGLHSMALKADGTVVAWGSDAFGQTSGAAGLTGVAAIAAGDEFSLALKTDGSVTAWGRNSVGQLNVPAEATGVVAIAAGVNHSLALKSDGTVAAWGYNGAGQTTVPTGVTGVVAIAAGGLHSLALRADGTIAAWGNSAYGQTNVPAGLTAPVKAISIAAGDAHALALKSDGAVVAWGDDLIGQTSGAAGLTGIVAIAGGHFHSLALKSDGTVAAWGDSSNRSVPAGLTGVAAIAAGYSHSLALKSDGTVAAWGADTYGQTSGAAGLTGVVAISGGFGHSLALKSNGTVAAWGWNSFGQTSGAAGLTGVVAIAGGYGHSLALKSDGNVTAWGLNGSGQTSVPAEATHVIAIAAGWNHSLALKSNGTVVAWGNNDYGQSTVPAGLTGVVAIGAGGRYSLALKSDGTVVAWGNNDDGQTSIPGSSNLSGLSLQEGTFDPSFQPSVTSYTYSYIGPSVSSANVSATLADSSNSSLFINNVAQTSGSMATVPITGPSTVIPVRVEPYLLPAQTYTITVHRDSTPPNVQFSVYGNAAPSQTAETVVTVADTQSGVDSASLQYAWTQSAAAPASGWSAFTSGHPLSKSGANGDWYLHIQAKDNAGNTVNTVSNRFLLDNAGPSVNLTMTKADASPYPDNTWTNQDVTVSMAASDTNGATTNRYSLDSGATWSVYTAPIVLQAEGVHTVSFKAVDSAGNETVEQRTVNIDLTAPSVNFGVNGSATWANSALTSVTVTDSGGSSLAPSTLRSAWTTNTAVPASGWTPFTSGTVLTKTGADGDWYLHIQAKDNVGNTVNTVSNRFRLDNTGPSVNITMTKADTNPYPDNTWTNQGVTVSAVASDPGSVTSITYSHNGGATWSGYTSPILLQNDSVHSLSFKAVDSAGNETVEQRTVKISKSGLRLTPTLKKADGSAYTSGAWTNGSVTASVYAEAGASGIAALTSISDGGPVQAYANQTPVPFAQEGTHTITFQVTDTAGNSLTASLAANIDLTAPSVSLGANGSETWANAASTSVTVTDSGGSNVAASTLRYAWTTNTAAPASDWTPFTSGTVLTKNGADGDWFLHIQAKDNAGNTVNTVSNRFRLENTGPSVNITMTKADSTPYPDNTWTNQNVTVSMAASDTNSATTNTYSLDGGATWSGYTTPIALQNDGVHSLSFKAVDSAGNETAEQRTVKISKSALRLTPTLTKADGSPYTSGAWTNGSVTASVHAEAGASGMAALTYSLDGGAAQTYVNNTPIAFDQDGTYSLLFLVTDTAGNTLSAPLAVNIDKTAPVVTLTGPSSMHITTGSSYTEQGAIATDSGSGTGAVVITGSVNRNVPGTYTLRYNVSDLAGNAAAEVTRTVIVDAAEPPPTSPGIDYGSAPAVTLPVIDLNGVSLDPAAIDTSKPSVTLEVTPKDGVAYVSIPATILTDLQDKSATFFIEIKTPYGSYQVPVNLASLIPGLKELLGKNNLKAEDISFKITLTDKSGSKDIQAAFHNGLSNGKVLGAIVDFSIEIVNAKTGQSIGTADNFSKALTRVIPMPREVTEMPEQWGAFRYNEATKKFEFVAATTRQIEGVWYVMIGSYSNSVYMVAQNEVSFADVQSHWSLPYVKLAAAKGLVEGVGGGKYDPNKAVTRAEFTAMLVRALDRGTTNDSQAPYDDVKQGAWYFGEVAAAKELGLLDFAGGYSFKPDQPLTREEMASMLAAVMTLEKLPMTKEFVSLDSYKDIGSVDSAFLEDVRAMVKLQIMTGTGEDTFSPKGESTRAQAAVVFIRTLQALGMID